MLDGIKNIFDRAIKRQDGWRNVVTNLGVGRSRTNSTHVGYTNQLDRYTLNELYRSNGIAKRIVSIVVDDALRGFVQCDPEIMDEFVRLKFKQKINDACCFGRLYGGAIIIAFIDDGMSLEKPLNYKRVNRVLSLRAFDRYEIQWTPDDLCRNFYKEYYGEPEVFTIRAHGYMQETDYFKIHRSRCFVVGGDVTDNQEKLNNQGWDNSVLQLCYNALRDYGIIVSSSSEIVQDFVQVLMKMNGLSDKLSRPDGEAEVKTRLDMLDISRSNANTILLDGDGAEDYEKKSSSVAGLADLWDRFSECVCAVSGIPATKLFGRSPAGLNSTGQSDLNNWHDVVNGYRSDQIEPIINWLLGIVKVQQGWQAKPETYEWEFPALLSPSEIELAEIKKKYAEIDAMYIDRGAIDPSEAWQARFGEGAFNINIQLTPQETDKTELEIEEENQDLLESEITQEEKSKQVLDAIYDKVKANE